MSIDTREPVTIENSTITGAGRLVGSVADGVDLTVRETVGAGAGEFIALRNPAQVTVERNDLVGTAGIRIEGFSGTGGPTIRIVANRATNVGAGGTPETMIAFAQLVGVAGVSTVEIAWNDVLNEPGRSRVEDNISIYRSSGTRESPIAVHDNFVDGAYPADPAAGAYTGGGIMLGDGGDAPGGALVADVLGACNVVVDTTNYGIGISAGRSVRMERNRVLSTGRLPDGQPVAAQNVGIYVWNLHDQAGFDGNAAVDNVVGWERPGRGDRNDFYLPDARDVAGNTTYPGPVTAETVAAEYAAWRARAAAAGIPIGSGR